MEPEMQRKIEETVIDLLRRADLEDMTEFKVRGMAAVRLGIDLSDIHRKAFVRGIVESFLLSDVHSDEQRNSNGSILEETKEVVQEEREPAPLTKDPDIRRNPVICQLSNKRNVMIQEVNGKSLVWIGEFYKKDGKQLPSHKGICLTTEQWSTFRDSIPAIQAAVMKMQSKLRSDLNGEHSGDGLNPVSSPPPPPRELVGIEISRFDGNNYQSWALKMEFFLNQLNIGYVLSDPCPSPPVSAVASPKEIAEAKAAQQKWINDNYMCRHHILNSLSDALHCHYSKKTKSAKELWETLKLVYLFEELGTKRFQVKKYVEFQMVDAKPVLEQIQEFNSIADSIVATGTLLDENFHVSVILSKLPPSWKDFCIKLMHEEYLPFWMLMDRVRVEEESRNRGKQGEPSSSVYFHHANNLGPRMRDMKKPGLHWKRNETETNKTIPVCSFCGKKGHISKNCRNRKLDKEVHEKHDGGNSSTPAVS